MEVHFTPEVQTKIEQMARETGRPSDELVEDAVIGYFNEMASTREMRDGRRTGADLIAAMQASPFREIEIEPARYRMPVRDVTF